MHLDTKAVRLDQVFRQFIILLPCFAVKDFVFPSSSATAFSSSFDEASPAVSGYWHVEGVGEDDARLAAAVVHSNRRTTASPSVECPRG